MLYSKFQSRLALLRGSANYCINYQMKERGEGVGQGLRVLRRLLLSHSWAELSQERMPPCPSSGASLPRQGLGLEL